MDRLRIAPLDRVQDHQGERETAPCESLPAQLDRAACRLRLSGRAADAQLLERAANLIERNAALLQEVKPHLPLQAPSVLIGRIDLSIAKARGQ